MPTSQKPRQAKEMKKKRVTSEDMPGNGMAKIAAEAIEARRAARKKLLDSL